MRNKKYYAIYLRISKEDKTSDRESNSIANQRKVIYAYIRKQMHVSEDEIMEFVDDGYSGTNFDRPGMNRLIKMIQEGKIKGVIVKDLSRFGRDHIVVGEYLEHIFPRLQVRFIAVNDDLDSDNYSYNLPGQEVAYKNLLNEFYSTLLSDNTRKSIYNKRKTGECVNAAPYGYMKKASTGNQLHVNPETSRIVKEIFRRTLAGDTKKSIAKAMNDRIVLTPGDYRKQKAGTLKPENIHYWTPETVANILKNEEYTGVAISGQYRRPEVGKPYAVKLPENQWERHENAHPALVTKDEFKRANALTGAPFIDSKHPREPKDCFTGFLVCGHCGHNMLRRAAPNRDTSYYCKYTNLGSKSDCPHESYKKTVLEKTILPIINQQVQLLFDLNQMTDYEKQTNKQGVLAYRTEEREAQKELTRLENQKFDLYRQLKTGEINEDEYLEKREVIETSITERKCRIAGLRQDIECSGDITEAQNLMKPILQFHQADQISRAMLEALVSEIRIWDMQHIQIKFRYQDQLRGV